MADSESPTNPCDPPDDRLQTTLTLLFLAVLLSVCIGVPIWLASSHHPGWGALAALASAMEWMYLGPPPMPGFLNGIVCLLGMSSIVGVFIGCASRACYLWLM